MTTSLIKIRCNKLKSISTFQRFPTSPALCHNQELWNKSMAVSKADYYEVKIRNVFVFNSCFQGRYNEVELRNNFVFTRSTVIAIHVIHLTLGLVDCCYRGRYQWNASWTFIQRGAVLAYETFSTKVCFQMKHKSIIVNRAWKEVGHWLMLVNG